MKASLLWGWSSGSVGLARLLLARRDPELVDRDYLSATKQVEFQTKALELARRDYEQQVRDDRQGLVTSLEVLESLNRLNTAELALNSANLSQRLAAVNREIAAGATPAEIFE